MTGALNRRCQAPYQRIGRGGVAMTVLTLDGLSFKLKPSSRRKTLQITADRGGELLL
jgi:hypothetical protein